jgi:hypothetical protein
VLKYGFATVKYMVKWFQKHLSQLQLHLLRRETITEEEGVSNVNA